MQTFDVEQMTITSQHLKYEWRIEIRGEIQINSSATIARTHYTHLQQRITLRNKLADAARQALT